MSNPYALFDIAPEKIDNQFGIAQGYASTAYSSAIAALDKLVNIGQSLALIKTNLVVDETTISPASLSASVPSAPNLNVNMPADPAEPTGLISAIFGALPTWPDPVSLSEIASGDNIYISAVLSELQSKLIANMIGSTGIDPDVENAIFNRESERALLEHERTLSRINASWAKTGAPIPNGALAALLQDEEINYTNKRLDASRDVSIKSFELTDQNTRFAIQQAVGLESALIAWANNVAERTFQVSKAAVDSQLSRHKIVTDSVAAHSDAIVREALGKIEYNKGLISQYAARVETYRARIQGEAARLDAVVRGYEGQIAAFKAETDFDISRAGLDLKVIDARINQALANGNLFIKDAELRMRHYEFLNQLKVEAQKGAAQIMAQLVAGALASINVSASVGASASAGVSFADSRTYDADTRDFPAPYSTA